MFGGNGGIAATEPLANLHVVVREALARGRKR